MPNGFGSVTLPDNGQYEGQFKNGGKHGKGILISPDGDRYEGQFKSDVPHGRGIYKWSDGRIYEGQLKDGLQHGKGKYTMPDGRYFEGEFKKGEQTKKGKYFWKDGTEYIEDEEKGLTITKEMFGDSSEDEEIFEISDKEKEDFLKNIANSPNDSGEPWFCEGCHSEMQASEEQFTLQYGICCLRCFNSVALGIDDDESI